MPVSGKPSSEKSFASAATTNRHIQKQYEIKPVSGETTARPAQPHPETLRQLVEARVNKRQFIDHAAASASIATSSSSGGFVPVVGKKFKTVGYLPGGVAINEPIALKNADLAKQAESLSKKFKAENLTDAASEKAIYSMPLLTKTGDAMTAVQALLETAEEADVAVNAAGFTCGICHVLLKDYTSYLNHLNSKAHLKATGQSLKLVGPVSVMQVQEKLAALKKQKEAQAANPAEYTRDKQLDAKAKWEDLERDEEAERAARKAAKKTQKLEKKQQQNIGVLDEDLVDELKEAGFDFANFGR